MRILIGCEFSGVVRTAFRNLGHDAWSCDLLEAEDGSEYHYQGDILNVLARDKFDLMIAFPPCTYLCSSGLHWNKRRPDRAEQTKEALKFIQTLMDASVSKIAIENPIGCISTNIRKPDQIIHPYMFGDDASKMTCLWLKNLPRLVIDEAKFVPPRIVNGKPRWGNQTDSGQNKLGPSPTRALDRSRTYQGIAEAMAKQWGSSD